jgi:hypothetical protein
MDKDVDELFYLNMFFVLEKKLKKIHMYLLEEIFE